MEQRRLLTTIDLATFSAADGTAIFGADAGDQAGLSVSSAGDLNGDGFDDMVVGAIGAGGSGNARPLAGDVHVIFGGPSQPATIDLASLGTAGFTIFGADNDNRTGRSATKAGDLNGDGYDDLILGALGGSGLSGAKPFSGETYILFGKPILPTSIDLATPNSIDITIYGAETGDFSGDSVLGVGDVNGDGFADILIGAAAADSVGNTRTNAGEAYLVYGATSLPTTINLATLGTAGVTIFGADAGDLMGRSVSGPGDVNGDGYDDLLLGANLASSLGNVRATAGESYVVYGGATLPNTIDLASLGTAGVVVYGTESGDQSGFSVGGAGDVNADGFYDFLIGAREADALGNAKTDAGETYLVYGGPTLPNAIDMASLGSAGITLFGADADDFSGGRVRGAGDINGDGFDDIAIGANLADGVDNLAPSAGEAYFVFGSASLPATIDLGDPTAVGITIYGADADDENGVPVGIPGDFNGDGFDDVLVGTHRADGVGNVKTDSGEVYLVFGEDFTGTVTHQGSAASETLAGDGSSNVIIGGRGDDTLIGNGGSDVLRGGEGDDNLVVSDLNFKQVNGANGFDSLQLDTAGIICLRYSTSQMIRIR